MKKLTLLIMTIYLVGCGFYKGAQFEDPNKNIRLSPVDNGEIIAIPNQKTASIQSAGSTLQNMVNCLGIKTPSARTIGVNNQKAGSISSEGKATTVTSPMLMAQTAIAAEACMDLVTIEKALTPDQRRIFTGIDFNRGPASVSAGAIEDTVQRLARSCWGRQDTPEERNLIRSAAQADFTSANRVDTDKQMVFVCSSILASLSGLEN